MAKQQELGMNFYDAQIDSMTDAEFRNYENSKKAHEHQERHE